MQTLLDRPIIAAETDTIDEIALAFRNINLDPIIFKLVNPEEGEGWTLDKAARHAEEFKFFFYMHYKFPQRTFVPTVEIDDVWHCLIQDTVLYRALCEKHLGYFLDHFPYLGTRGEEDELLLKSLFEETKQTFAEHFPSFFGSSVNVQMFANTSSKACQNIQIQAGCNGCGKHCGRCTGDVSSSLTLAELYLLRPTV